MQITYLGHGCVSIAANGKTLLIDPFITGNPLAKDISIDNLKADYILITHAHQDHILDVEAIAKRTGAKLISNYEIIMHYGAKGFDGHPVNHGGTCVFDDIAIKYVNAVHASSFPDGSYGGQPGGFVISFKDKSVYIAGDTAVTFDMKLIPLQTKLDLAILPIGDNFTMGVDDAILASDFVECNKVLGCHYNTFPPIKIDEEKAVNKFKSADKELILLSIGNSIAL
jgi:L-ascorbate metabolism protein UlaG (beta-lactamase superfamily)